MRINNHKLLLFSFVIGMFLLVGIFAIDSNSYHKIHKKEFTDLLRIGYVNLNQSKISKEELIRLEGFKCDLWLFAEWNGDNLDYCNDFKEGYNIIFELEDAQTYGCYVLAKKGLIVEAEEFDQKNRPYVCDYPKILIKSDDYRIAFIHAPPPVPKCKFETTQYLSDLFLRMEAMDDLKSQLIVGDFNTVPFQNAYNSIIKLGFVDAFSNESILNGTYGAISEFPKFIRIDYMFARGNISCEYAQRFIINNSDHCGLIADFRIE